MWMLLLNAVVFALLTSNVNVTGMMVLVGIVLPS